MLGNVPFLWEPAVKWFVQQSGFWNILSGEMPVLGNVGLVLVLSAFMHLQTM